MKQINFFISLLSFIGIAIVTLMLVGVIQGIPDTPFGWFVVFTMGFGTGGALVMLLRELIKDFYRLIE